MSEESPSKTSAAGEERRPPIHPGEILLEDFLKPLGITQYRLAKEIGVSQTRIAEIIAGTRGITADTAARFGRFFGSSPAMWLNFQTSYELQVIDRLGIPGLENIRHWRQVLGVGPDWVPAEEPGQEAATSAGEPEAHRELAAAAQR